MLLGTKSRLTKADATEPIPVASTGVVYTPSFPLYGADAFGVALKCASVGDIDVKVELEVGMERPATEESADDDWAEADGTADVAIITDTDPHPIQMTPVPSRYGRYKMTGQGSNHATTTIRMDLFLQERT